MNFVTNVLKKYIQNEPQEVAKEVAITVSSPSPNKENMLKAGSVSDHVQDVGFGLKQEAPQARRSVLKSFDPLYDSPSTHQVKPQKYRQQLIIEDSDTDSPRASLDLDENHGKSAFDPLYASDCPLIDLSRSPKHNIDESDESYKSTETSPRGSPNPENGVAESELVLLDDKEPESTSSSDQAEAEFPKIRDITTREKRLSSPHIISLDFDVPPKKQRIDSDSETPILQTDKRDPPIQISQIVLPALSINNYTVPICEPETSENTDANHSFEENTKDNVSHQSSSSIVGYIKADTNEICENNTSIDAIESSFNASVIVSNTLPVDITLEGAPSFEELEHSAEESCNAKTEVDEDVTFSEQTFLDDNKSEESHKSTEVEKAIEIPNYVETRSILTEQLLAETTRAIPGFREQEEILLQTLIESCKPAEQETNLSGTFDNPEAIKQWKSLSDPSADSPKSEEKTFSVTLTEERKSLSGAFVGSPELQKSVCETFGDSPKATDTNKTFSQDTVESPKTLTPIVKGPESTELKKSQSEFSVGSPKSQSPIAPESRKSLPQTIKNNPELNESLKAESKTSVESPKSPEQQTFVIETIVAPESRKSLPQAIIENRKSTESLKSELVTFVERPESDQKQNCSPKAFIESPKVSADKESLSQTFEESPKYTEQQVESPKGSAFKECLSQTFEESPKYTEQQIESSTVSAYKESLSQTFEGSPKYTEQQKSLSDTFVEAPESSFLRKSLSETFESPKSQSTQQHSLSDTFVEAPESSFLRKSLSETFESPKSQSTQQQSLSDTFVEASESSSLRKSVSETFESPKSQSTQQQSLSDTFVKASESSSLRKSLSETVESPKSQSTQQQSLSDTFVEAPESSFLRKSLSATSDSPKSSTQNTSSSLIFIETPKNSQPEKFLSDTSVKIPNLTDSVPTKKEDIQSLGNSSIAQSELPEKVVVESTTTEKNNEACTKSEEKPKSLDVSSAKQDSSELRVKEVEDFLEPGIKDDINKCKAEPNNQLETDTKASTKSKSDSCLEKEQYLDSSFKSIEESFNKSAQSPVDDLKRTKKVLTFQSSKETEAYIEKLDRFVGDESQQRVQSDSGQSKTVVEPIVQEHKPEQEERGDFKSKSGSNPESHPVNNSKTVENIKSEQENETDSAPLGPQIESETINQVKKETAEVKPRQHSNHKGADSHFNRGIINQVEIETAVIKPRLYSTQKGGDSNCNSGSTSDGDKSIPNNPIDVQTLVAKMADLSEKLSEQQQQNSDLKLQLNASQQAKASLELEIRQKEEIIIKTQAEALKNEQIYKQELKQLKEKLKEKSKLIEKDGSKELEEQLKEAKAKEAKAIAELNQRNKDDLNYQKIMDEYENTIAARLSEFQKLKEEHATATNHLANIELAFSDVHKKYERTKTLLEGFKSNEEALSLSLQASEKTCKQHEERYESLKAHAKAQIEKSNKEILMLRDKYEMDINKLKAIIKRLEIKCSSLEVSLQQKTEECAALSALCDEVTGKRV